MEITLNGKTYNLKFGVGFIRELDKQFGVVQSGVHFGTGLSVKLTELYSGNSASLADVMYAANRTESLRFTQKEIDDAIDNGELDLDKMFDDVIAELKESNATGRATKNFEKTLAEQKK